MKHATSDDLKSVDQLLEKVRKIQGIVEKQPGHFYHKGKNVLHFHEEHGSLFADIGDERMKVSEFLYREIVKKVEIYISEIKLARDSEKIHRS
ncbi:MAG: hypothetical protein AMDU1_APLC00037G0018 [Thermoplasmatales archaeon A-plasma]|jgi:hypothetical protein|nr:MAG: hypothetical protein AMDU1_APLC00037G0018 [Thermoplasmatales archaeon A-plasma]WMT44212.1 MAG: hypothetical protein RE469_08385 [Cuniculiplasma divulgatum]